ncbi:MAG: alpha-D-ribose 1-methylphosphonate 5-triphosphate diphosphatase, partial [Pseudomonadota bacterium]
GGMRGPDFARRLVTALAALRGDLLTDMHVQLRIETSMIEDFAAIEEFVGEAGIRMVVFNDHLPHKALSEGRAPPRLSGQSLKAGRSPEAHWALLRELHERQAEVPDAVAGLAARLAGQGVLLGSHDDRTAETRAWYRGLGASIAEFPETEEALVAAQKDTIVLGAPNVMRGGSHKKGLSARDAAAAGRCDVLVSDYHYASLRAAALKLEADGLAAWPMVSEAPARALGMSDRGRLEPGRRADLTVLGAGGRVVGTMVNGRWSYMTAPLYEALA